MNDDPVQARGVCGQSRRADAFFLTSKVLIATSDGGSLPEVPVERIFDLLDQVDQESVQFLRVVIQPQTDILRHAAQPGRGRLPEAWRRAGGEI